MVKEKIAVRIPNMGFVSANVSAFCCLLERKSSDPRLPFDFDCGFLSYTTPWDHARNAIVDDFLKKDFSRLWFIDSDIVPSPASLRLLLVDADIAAGPYPIWGRKGPTQRPDLSWSVYEWVEKDEGYIQPDMPDFGVEERDGAATGMMIIKRRVLEDKRMYYSRNYTSWTGRPKRLPDSAPGGIFLNRHKPNGQYDATEDLDFCYRAKKLGYTLKVDYAVKCGHLKQADVLDVAKYSVAAYEHGFEDAINQMAAQADGTAGLIEVAH